MKKKTRQLLICVVLTMLLAVTAVLGYRHYDDIHVYAVRAGGEDVCYLASEEEAGAVIQKVIEANTPEGAELTDSSLVGITIGRAPLSTDKSAVMSVDEAVKCFTGQEKNWGPVVPVKAGVAANEKKPVIKLTMTAYAEKGDEEDAVEAYSPGIILTSYGSETRKIPYKTEYVKDDSLMAGEAVVETEGKNGKEEVYCKYTSVNGKIAYKNDLETKVLKEAVNEVIHKGTLGLPEGEDWQTYEGDPVFNSAEDLIATSMKYLGAPYKYGGKSLTNGIDCVQFVRQMFAKYGISIPNRHSDIWKVGKGVSLKNIQKGDIVCYKGHVAIYIGNNKVINATRKHGVAISNLHMNKKLITIRRVPH